MNKKELAQLQFIFCSFEKTFDIWWDTVVNKPMIKRLSINQFSEALEFLDKGLGYAFAYEELAIEHLKSYELRDFIEETRGTLAVPSDLPMIQCDPSQIKLLLLNLIRNALGYHKENVPPIVTIRAYDQQDGKIKVEVEDNGLGIKCEQRENIFAMFKRMHSRQEYEGAGIGLTLCKKIIEKHEGEIGVSSVYSQGSTFWFTLPVLKTLKKKQKELVAASKD